MEILSSFVTVSSGKGNNRAKLSNSAFRRSLCLFDGLPGLEIHGKNKLEVKYQLYFMEVKNVLNVWWLRRKVFYKTREEFRGENCTQTSHQLGSNRFSLTNSQTPHDPTRNTKSPPRHHNVPMGFLLPFKFVIRVHTLYFGGRQFCEMPAIPSHKLESVLFKARMPNRILL